MGAAAMKRLLLAFLSGGLLIAAVCYSGTATNQGGSASGPLQVEVANRNPWQNLRLTKGTEQIHFAIVSDRTGGHRAGIFSKAVTQLNLMQPEFVVSVGDLIEGGSTPEKTHEQWKEFQTYVNQLQM